MSSSADEEKERLWVLVASPSIWALHLVASYATAAVWCAKAATRGSSLFPARVAIGVFTIIALALIVIIGWGGLRRHGRGTSTLPHDADTPESRHRFLGFATFLLSGLSAIAVVYETIPAVLIGSCR